MPSLTVTVKISGSVRNSLRSTPSVISLRIASSVRSKTDSTSARLMMPTRCPSASVTGSRLTRRSYMSLAACSTVSSGRTATTAVVIRSPAVTPRALAWSLRCRMPTSTPGSSSRASLASMSASETTPITLRSSSTTGNALTRCSRRATAISRNVASFLTQITRVVMISWTVVIVVHSSGEDDLERPGVLGAGEYVVGLFELVEGEVVGDERLDVELAGGDQAEEGRRGGGVHQAGGDRDVPDPLLFQVQRGGLAVHADVGDPAAGPGQLDGQLERGGHADGLDGHVHAQAAGQVLDSGQRVFAGVVHHDVGAEVLGCLEPGVRQVDGHDAAGAVEPCAGDGRQPDRPGSDHRDHVARTHAAGQHAHLVAGRQDVGQHEGLLVAHPVGDPERGGVRVRHPDELGLGAVDLVTEDPATELGALAITRLAAVPAAPAGADAGDEHAVARAQAAHAVAGLPDGPDGLVSQDPARLDRRHVTPEDVQVSPADGGGVDLHDDVAVVGDLRVGHFFPGFLTGTVVDEGSHGFLHWIVASSTEPRLKCQGKAGPLVLSLRVEGHRNRGPMGGPKGGHSSLRSDYPIGQ